MSLLTAAYGGEIGTYGLALTGRKTVCAYFTAFASRRCFDQLFMALDYQRNNVKAIASDAGARQRAM